MIIEDTTQQFEASLIEPSGCWIGNSYTSGPLACNSMSADEVSNLNSDSCDCSTYFKAPINPNWNGSDTRRTLSFMPDEKLLISNPSVPFNLLVNFTYNSSQLKTVSVGSPNLEILISDPSINPVDAVDKGMSSLAPFNANGVTNIMLSLNHYDVVELPSHFAYNPVIYTSPYLNLPCDVGKDPNASPCQTLIRIRFAGMQLTSYVESVNMRWTDVAGSAASYFALVQFLSWVFSGLAWTA